MQNTDTFAGKTFPTPKGGIITVLGVVQRIPNRPKYVWMSCSICSDDDELWPEGSMCCLPGALTKGCVPCSCSKKPTLTLEQHMIITKRLLVGTPHKVMFVSRPKENGSVVATILCPDHGEWTCSTDSIKNRTHGCMKCYRSTISNRVRKPESDARKEIIDVAAKLGHEFIEFIGGYTGSHSRASMKCIDHGYFDVLVTNYRKEKANCPKCRYIKTSRSCKKREPVYIERILSALDGRSDKFLSWDGEFSGAKSKLILDCAEHGAFSVHYGNLLNGAGCPKCAGYGFQSSDSGFVYLLESMDKSAIKVGISNKPDQRIRQLRNATPFEFSVLDMFEMNGVKALSVESDCHSEFMSAGLSGFDGCTEWMRHDPAIIEYIQQRA